MRSTAKLRPFDGFKTAVTDPDFFFGRDDVIESVLAVPSAVNVLIGGRRIGKTSALRALEWRLLSPPPKNRPHPFPVYVSLNVEQPSGLDNFRYLLIRRLRDAIERWSKSPGTGWREQYRSYLRQVSAAEVRIGSLINLKIENPEQTRRLVHEDFRHALLATLRDIKPLDFEGVIFVLDEAEYVVRRDWANDAWSYFRGLKDTDTALKPFLGIVLAGYRDIKVYAQQVGSPLLGIANVSWMAPLKRSECNALVAHRCLYECAALRPQGAALIDILGGGHPFLVQQILNFLIDDAGTEVPHRETDLVQSLLANDTINRAFAMWWNEDNRYDGFDESERRLYRALARRQEASVSALASDVETSVSAAESGLEVLAGTGVAHVLGQQRYGVGSKLFEEWVARQ